MLISLTLENWMSFKDEVTFSMVATRERQHGERVPKLAKYSTRVLPIAAIYGGNASGKTNFFKALAFAKDYIVKGSPVGGMIAVEPFRLNAECANRPTRFRFELMVGEAIYEYTFAVTRETVVEERLVAIGSSSEKTLFHRIDGKPHFHTTLAKEAFLQFAFRGTRDNQLFLTNAVSQKVETFLPIYSWFRDTLELMAPDARFAPFEPFLDKDHPHYSILGDILGRLDTGISHLGTEGVPFDSVPIPEADRAKLQASLSEGQTVRLLTGPSSERYLISRRSGELVAQKIVAFHQQMDGSDVKFDMDQESDGSKRVVDLLPAILSLAAGSPAKVYMIDEIDRSLHTLLTRRLLEIYLDHCSVDSRSQLLFTTHDVQLMDQSIFRRDEMWVAERSYHGVSQLDSLSDFKDIRYDKDIRKSYLRGRLGGVPKVSLGNFVSATNLAVADGDED